MSSTAAARVAARAITHGDHTKTKTNGVASLREQVDAWLQRSCLSDRDIPGALIPKHDSRNIEFYDIDGQRRPDWDLLRQFEPTHGFRQLVKNDPDYKPPKYLAAEDQPPHLYYPRTYKSSWRLWTQSKTVRKVLVEGPAKAACITKFGVPAVGIQGCWGWRSLRHGMLHLPELNDIYLSGDVYWIPDHDRRPDSVRDVLRASSAFYRVLVNHLQAQRVHIVWLPLLEGYDKVGIDDFLYHYSRSGRDIKAGRRALEELLETTPLWKDFDFTEPDDSRRWVAANSQSFRYCGTRRTWFFYTAGMWHQDATLQQQETLKCMYNEMLQDSLDSGNSELAALIRKDVTAVRLQHVSTLSRSDPVIVARAEEFDRHRLWLNCTNGTLELPSRDNGRRVGDLRFRAHDPADMLTRQVIVPYDDTATCPRFLEAMRFWTNGDATLERTVRQLLGISLTGLTNEQIFIILWGASQTGKSTLMELFKALMGTYAKSLNADKLLLRRNAEPEERKVASLPGIRFAPASETEHKGVIDENFIKALTGEDTMSARRLYQEDFDFMPEAKIWLRTNNKPEIRSLDNSLWRRLIVVPFGHVVAKRDGNLRSKLLATEGAGILRWAVEGYLDYTEAGLVKAEVVEQTITEYRRDQDTVQRFLDDKCCLGNDAVGKPYSIRREELYLSYATWCDGVGQVRNKMSIKEFREQLQKRGIAERRVLVATKPYKKQEIRWIGITLQMKAEYEKPTRY